MATNPEPSETGRSDLGFTLFAWFFALAVLFQLARGDMGLFPAWRGTPNGTTFGDGPIPQIWFACALLTLIFPQRLWSLILLALAGVNDLWWRLPLVTPSIYFHGFVSAQVLVTALVLVVRKRSWRITPAEFIAGFRPAVTALLAVLLFAAVFHKLTYGGAAHTAVFFQLLERYYVPFLPTAGPALPFYWLLTVGGEFLIAVALLFPRTRPLALLVGVGFVCLIGSVVYGFGSIVLAALIPLAEPRRLLEPLDRLAAVRFVRRFGTAQTRRIAFALALGTVFIVDHATGFTLADRGWLFAPDKKPHTLDVLTPMQFVWFTVSTAVLVGVLIAAYRYRTAIVTRIVPAGTWTAYALAVFFLASEAGIYVGIKERPAVTMFSGLHVRSCEPNHRLIGNRLYWSFFHRDLLLVTTPEGERIGIPALSLRTTRDRSLRLGNPNRLVDIYRNGRITRLRDGVEGPFDFEDLDSVRPLDWLDALVPRRLFYLPPADVASLRCCMPDLFPPQGPVGDAAGSPP